MTGEKKSSGKLPKRHDLLARSLSYLDFANRFNVKNSKKLLSKTSKPSTSTISPPPKAAIASSSERKEDVQRRRNLNDILRRRSGDAAVPGRSPTLQDVALDGDSKTGADVTMVDTRMAEKVAELERALSLAREEQNALREALEESRRHRHENRQTPGDSRQEHGQSSEDAHQAPQTVTTIDLNMHDENLEHWSDSRSSPKSVDTADYRPSSSHSHDDLLRQNYNLRSKLAHLQDQLSSQDTARHPNTTRALSYDDLELDVLRSRLHATEKESQSRLAQLLSLKSSISTLTRTDAQATDAELVDAFKQLANRIREWVISNFRKTRLDVENLPVETVRRLRCLAPAYECIESTDRLALYQAVVSSAMMQIFEEPLVLGLPNSGPSGAVRVFAENMRDTGTAYRDWRRATLRLLDENEELLCGKNDVLHRMAAEITHFLFTLTSVTLSPHAHSALMGILSAAAELQRMLVLQKARYQVLLFCNVGFDERRMESVNDLDSMADDDEEMNSSEHQFLFCVFPCLEKFGDEWGDNIEVSNVLLKARVCCGVG